MKKWVLMLGVSFLSFSSFATDYKANTETCKNFEGIENDYRSYPGPDTKLRHAWCLIIKGNDLRVQDKNLVEEGLKMLRDLVDEEKDGENNEYDEYIIASYYYGFFYYTKGVFDTAIAKKNLNLVERHFTKIFEYIKKNPSYSKEYAEWEKAHAIGMGVYSKLPNVYLQMYLLRLVGDFRVLNSEDEDKDTYSEYVESATHYIDLAKMHAEECRDLGDKYYFRKTDKLFKEVCAMKVERIEGVEDIEGLKQIQVERQEALEECGEDVSEKSCPEIHRLNKKFVDEYLSIFKAANEILKEGEDILHATSSE